MLVITAPAMTAIMTILARDATAWVWGLLDVFGRPFTALSFYFDLQGMSSKMPWHTVCRLPACIYKENLPTSGIILPFFDRAIR
jgi:hypothetical protein